MDDRNLILGLAEIQEILPHRAPMLLVDGVTYINPGVSIRAYRDFRSDDVLFRGHFPNSPILPGVLTIEAIAQAAGILAQQSSEADAGKTLPCLLSVTNAKFRNAVFPGDRLECVVDVVHTRGDVWKFMGRAYVANTLAAEAVLLATGISTSQLERSRQVSQKRKEYDVTSDRC